MPVIHTDCISACTSLPAPVTPAQELQASGPDVATCVRDAVEALSGRPVHGADGRFLPGTPAALVTGRHSLQLQHALEPARRALVAQVTADLGGDVDGLPATLARLVGAFSETSLLRESVFIRMAGQPTTNKGKARAMLSAYVALVDRELRLAQAIGLERKARRTRSFVEELEQLGEA